MNRNVLYLKANSTDESGMVQEVLNRDYHVVECCVEVEFQRLEQMLNKDFFYFVCSDEFDEDVHKVCLKTATKYVIGFAETPAGVLNCYSVNKADKLLEGKEAQIYELINEIYYFNQNNTPVISGLKELKGYSDEQQIMKLTDEYFDRMEAEKDLHVSLKELLLEYINELLEKKDKNSWREITLWNKRYECRKLCNSFWQFYLLQKVSAIFSEEMINYYETGEEPSIIQFESFEAISETYFRLLLLLRRLEYGATPEEETEFLEYLMERKVSGIFVRHVIEHNQIENKEKVYKRFEELLLSYGQ